MSPPLSRRPRREDRTQRTLALEAPPRPVVLPVHVHPQALSLLAQMLLSIARNRPTSLADEPRQNHPAA